MSHKSMLEVLQDNLNKHMEICDLKRKVKKLTAENERRTEQLNQSMAMTDSCIENINRLTAKNERLRKAGDAMAERIDADGQPHLETDDWEAAKSGN